MRAVTNGTRWTNKQLLFHMVFGFLLVRVLLVVVKGFGRLPAAVSLARTRRFLGQRVAFRGRVLFGALTAATSTTIAP